METNEIALIKDAQAGNLKAFEELIQRYESRVLSLAYQVLGNTQDAEDVYQEVFMKVHKNIQRFEFKSDFFTWLYRIVVNAALSYRRKRFRHEHVSIEASEERNDGWHWTPVNDTPEPDQVMLNQEVVQMVYKGVEQLPMMQRVVFILRYFEEFKLKEIAEITNCSEGAVKNHLFRSTQKMKKALSSYVQADA